MEGPRSPTLVEYPKVLEFLKENLRPDQAWTIDKEYPTALTPANIHNMQIITDETKTVLSHAVLRPTIIKTPIAAFKVGAIGSVITCEKARNQGLSKNVIQKCEELAKKQDCEIAILWSSLHDFYRKLGYELAGHEVSFHFNKPLQEPDTELRYMTGVQVSADSLLRVFQQHTIHSMRTVDEVKKYLSIPKTNLYTAWDKNSQLVAYAAEGKGADLSNYIHEWGGSTNALMSLFSYISKTRNVDLTVIVPKNSQNLIRTLEQSGATRFDGFLGMIKILDTEEVFSKIKKHARNQGMMDFVLEKRDKYYLGFAKDLLEVDDEKALARILFGPTPLLPFEKPESQQKFDKILPLPIWIWGWDSI
jgi:hypothetical protein